MKLDQLQSDETGRFQRALTHMERHRAVLPRSFSRREFLQAAAGASAAGAAVGSGLLGPRLAEAGPGIGNVLPISGGLTLFGQQFHVFAPPATAPDDDPSTVGNFQGAAAIALIDDSVVRTNRKTGETRELPSLANHMTFMKGVYRGRDGHARDGAFSLIWIDVYDPSLGDAQVHDLNPGITQNGLFWTVVLDPEDVQVSLTAGTATLEVHDIHVKDYFDLENALIGGGNNPRPAIVSFKVVWTATGGPINIDKSEPEIPRRLQAGECADGVVGPFEWLRVSIATARDVHDRCSRDRTGEQRLVL
jgi:hypothetical protein